MKKLDTKIVSSTLALVLGAFATFSSANQIQGFVSGFAPGKVNVTETANGTDKKSDLHSDIAWSVGGEMLSFPAGPLMIGGGLGFFSVQQDGDDYVVMPAVPVWLSIGAIGPEKWSVRPYVEARVGYPFPAAKFSTWWSKPLNLLVEGNVGVQLPYHLGVEFNCAYLTMDKNFKEEDVNFRLSSLKFGGSITVHFDLSKKSAEPAKDDAAKVNAAVEPVPQESSSESASGVSDITEPPVAEPAPEEVPAESATEPTSEVTEEQPAAEAVEPAPEEAPAEAVAEEPVAESVDAPVEEAPAEEPVAEAAADTVAAPVEEPAPEPVVKKTPAKKKAAKKATKKKAATKKAAKKTTKKKK